MALCEDPLKRNCANSVLVDGGVCNICYEDRRLRKQAREEAVEALPPQARRAYDVLEARGDWMAGRDLMKAIESTKRGMGILLTAFMRRLDAGGPRLIEIRTPPGKSSASNSIGYDWRVKPL